LLAPYRPRTMGVEVDALLEAVVETLREVEQLGPDRLGDHDRAGIPKIDWGADFAETFHQDISTAGR
jgi:hypothetical protein